jgi:hypothetical protein
LDPVAVGQPLLRTAAAAGHGGSPRIYHRDWRIENDPQAVAVFQLGLSELNLVFP